MSVEVVLLRHAHSEASPEVDDFDRELSPMGLRQAEALVPRLRGLKITRIIASPAPRVLQTIEPFAQQENLRVATDPDLRERELCGGYRDDFDELVRASFEDLNWKLEGYESLRDAQYRMVRAIKVHVARQRHGKLLIASHGQAIAMFLAYLGRHMSYQQWSQMRMPEVFRVAI